MELWSYKALPNCRLYIDSQTTIKAIERPQRQSGQSIVKDLLSGIDVTTGKHTHSKIEIV